jgi:single-stranded-DNA-specific exonuclease
MKWTIKHNITAKNPQQRLHAIIDSLYFDRKLLSPTEIDAFLKPPNPLDLTPEAVGIDPVALDQALNRIRAAVNNRQPIIIYGDYDADGITATAILWEALHQLGAKAIPFIPDRELHGYGLSIAGLKDALSSFPPTKGVETKSNPPLIITVDNGIVAHEAAQYLHDRGFELIITDHHQPGRTIPISHSLVQTGAIAGSGVAWMLAKILNPALAESTLDLVTIGTVADMLPLTGVNRSIVKTGLVALRQTQRPGIQALFSQAGIKPKDELSTYHINFIIAPRLNAMGRLKHAIDSLRLLCTKNASRARELASLLDQTNRDRQDLTVELLVQAQQAIIHKDDSIIVIDHPDFHEGVIGLVAGKLAETYARPTIVIARGQAVSKASARSVSGVNIIELIRRHEALLINAGGHPMAAGFSIETSKIQEFSRTITLTANQTIAKSILQPELSIDCHINLNDITPELFQSIEPLKPFGIANARPVFAVTNLQVANTRQVGRDHSHLKLTLQNDTGPQYSAIGFGLGEHYQQILSSKKADVAFTIDENIWNSKRELQLKLKDIKVPG